MKETEELRLRLSAIIENLILVERVDTFLFGSKSSFDSLCYHQVTALKEKYPFIRRVYVRAEFFQISDVYKAYLLQSYEDTYYPETAVGAGKAVYIQRNRAMIEQSRFCVVYFCEDYSPKTRKSGTKAALEYAMRKNREIILLP